MLRTVRFQKLQERRILLNDSGDGAGGIIPVYKPSGPTSHDMVAMLRKRFGIRKIGHTGTLDPLAEGLLLCCTGKCTRLSRFFMALDKEYRALARFGASTDTMDSEGRILNTVSGVELETERLALICKELVGESEQTPPMFSAVKRNGKPLYRLARQGKQIVLTPRPINIYKLALMSVEGDRAHLKIRCSSGTYIRALIDDIGKRTGFGAYLESLTRTAIGPFDIRSSYAPEQINELECGEMAMIPEKALEFLPAFVTTRSEGIRFSHGQNVKFDPMRYRAPVHTREKGNMETSESGPVLDESAFLTILTENGNFLGIGSKGESGTVKPIVVFRPGGGET